jgi:uncharacterized membrane protein YdjX (TVP38/TMEM64 family)
MKNKIILIILIALGITLFYLFDLGRYLTLANLKANRDNLLLYYSHHKLLFTVGFIGIYALQTTLSLPGAAILTLAGGAVFGAGLGTVWVNIGATTGAIFAFLLARTLLRDWVKSRFGSKMEALDKGITENGMSYLLFLRLVPIFPFFLVNLACGVTGLKMSTYILGTMIGILPGSFVYANAGASLAAINSLREVASPRVLIAFALLGLFALIPAIYRIVAGRKGSPAEEKLDE